jgi:gamma-glutamyl-gamma-aminobutyrate hydrolase PuuD
MTSFNAQSLGKTVEAHDVTRESSVIGVPIHKTALNNNNNYQRHIKKPAR